MRPTTFSISDTDFLIDGKPTILRSGEMHFPRIPRPYWRHRLQMLKSMGLNAVATYDFWNLHEPRPGRWNFAGEADIAAYCKLAQEEGLYVLLRPGPYVCAEWELGGMPSWLLKTKDIALRTRDPRFLAATERYVKRLAKELLPLQVQNGGPILMVQAENEYGSYGNDKEYIAVVRDMWKRAGFTVPVFTCDGPSQLWNGSRTDTFCGVNGGVGSLRELRRFRPKGPLIVTEYYPGWLSHWAEPFPKVGTDGIVRDVEYFLKNNVSFNLYMAHGGTSFGLWAGSNSPKFAPDTTSYDYDAPVSEAGWATPKFRAIREKIGQVTGERLPAIPAPIPTVAIPEFKLTRTAPLSDLLVNGRKSERPQTMEALDQHQGILVYRTTVPAGPEAPLAIKDLHDKAYVFLDGRPVGSADRRRGRAVLRLPARTASARLEILVEALGRVNYGPGLHDRKGITKSVTLGEAELTGWEHFPIELWEGIPRGLTFAAPTPAVPDSIDGAGFWHGTFDLPAVGDTFLDTRNLRHGMVWVNGRHLGRYWKIGPQQTLYCPGCWLKRGRNEVVVFELEGIDKLALQGLREPILNDLRPEPPSEVVPVSKNRKLGQNLSLISLSTVWEGELPKGRQKKDVKFDAPATGRFVCLETLGSFTNDAYATLSELEILGADGRSLKGVKLVYADSEETEGDPGTADNVLDDDTATFWHTQWSGASPAHPHALAFDLGRETTIIGLWLTPRQDSDNGQIKGAKVYVRRDAFPGI